MAREQVEFKSEAVKIKSEEKMTKKRMTRLAVCQEEEERRKGKWKSKREIYTQGAREFSLYCR